MSQPMSSTTPKFFGLSALGATDPFHTKLKNTVMIDIFTDDDVRQSFARTQFEDGAGVKLEDFLEDLYHGEYPEHELERITEFLVDEGVDAAAEPVPLGKLLLAMEHLRTHSKDHVHESVYTVGHGSEFTSNQLMREYRFKHIRLKDEPHHKYQEPLTTSQQVGWPAHPTLDAALKKPHNPKKSCPETKYQDALVKTGITYR
mmetsp:Transcript_31121/g.69886  ORF Transcript_31121/g.69886 Transcript_31121/m.69886 type:complete len:202 (+) Transcript_31121:136-741(+)